MMSLDPPLRDLRATVRDAIASTSEHQLRLHTLAPAAVPTPAAAVKPYPQHATVPSALGCRSPQLEISKLSRLRLHYVRCQQDQVVHMSPHERDCHTLQVGVSCDGGSAVNMRGPTSSATAKDSLRSWLALALV